MCWAETVPWESRLEERAAWALGKVAGASAVEPLTAALQDEDSAARRCAAEGLGQVEDPRTVERLIASLKDQEENKARFGK